MIPANLTAPIDYEAFYASADSDEAQRFAALSTMLKRLEEAEWLSDGVHSVHLIDWDWRSESRTYNHRHVPMTILTPEIFDWYREYGAFICLDKARADRFSFARFFFKLAPRRDVVIVRFDLTGKQLFKVDRECRKGTMAERTGDPGAVFTPETITVHMNRDRAIELCRPLTALLAAFREQYPVADRPMAAEIISLADTIGNLDGPVSNVLANSAEAKVAGDAYVKLPEQAFEAMGDDSELLLHGPDAFPQERASEVTPRDIRVLLANLAVHAYLVPESLRDSRIAIVPGIAQIEDGKPMAAGGFLLHYDGADPHASLGDWLLLAATWAREKAAFDLVERSRRQQLGKFLHNIANRFGGLISRVRALEPSEKARALADEMEDIEGFSKAATAWVRGQAKNTDHAYGSAADLLAGIVDDVLLSLAGNEDVLINYFGRRNVPYDDALRSIEETLVSHGVPESWRTMLIRLSRRLAREVLGELIKNALEYTPWSAFPDGKIVVIFASDIYGPYVDVNNLVADASLPALDMISDALRRKRDPDVIGLGIKALTTLCGNEGLPPLKMTVDKRQPAVTFRCHLAKLISPDHDPPDQGEHDHETAEEGARS